MCVHVVLAVSLSLEQDICVCMKRVCVCVCVFKACVYVCVNCVCICVKSVCEVRRDACLHDYTCRPSSSRQLQKLIAKM